jgi:Immunoglobulin I-set domain
VNGVELPPSPKFFQTVVGEQVVLEIRDVVREDAGVYTCRARSAIGEASTSTKLVIAGQQKFCSAGRQNGFSLHILTEE